MLRLPLQRVTVPEKRGWLRLVSVNHEKHLDSEGPLVKINSNTFGSEGVFDEKKISY